jgi:hypothetical protein
VIPAAVRIFVSTEPIDMRQGFDRLGQRCARGSVRIRKAARYLFSPTVEQRG